MFKNFLVLFVICGIGVSNPNVRRKRQIPFTNPWAQLGQAFASAYAGPFIPIPIPFPVTGSSVSTGTTQQPQQYPTYNSQSNFPTWQWPSWPSWPAFNIPTFNFPIPWYKGENVCVETRYADEPDAFKGFGDVNIQGSQHSRSESCTGSSDVYICRGRKTFNENGKELYKEYMTKYQCCYGFVRPHDGSPGCIESNTVKTGKPTSVEIVGDNLDETTYYTFVPLEKGNKYAQPASTNTQTAGAANTQSAVATSSKAVANSNSHVIQYGAVPTQ